MSSALLLTPFQRAVLRRLAGGVSDHQSDELSLLLLLEIFLVLETLEVSPTQIESILGEEVTRFFNETVDAHGQDSPSLAAWRDVRHTMPTCGPGGAGAADLPVLTVDGRRVPYFGVVNPDGRIAYSEAAQRWLQEHHDAARP
jgi:hypothetical protein